MNPITEKTLAWSPEQWSKCEKTPFKHVNCAVTISTGCDCILWWGGGWGGEQTLFSLNDSNKKQLCILRLQTVTFSSRWRGSQQTVTLPERVGSSQSEVVDHLFQVVMSLYLRATWTILSSLVVASTNKWPNNCCSSGVFWHHCDLCVFLTLLPVSNSFFHWLLSTSVYTWVSNQFTPNCVYIQLQIFQQVRL